MIGIASESYNWSPPKLKSDQHLLQKKIKNQMRLDKVFDSILHVQAMVDNVFDTMNRYEHTQCKLI